jgi:hypothetical protein
MANTYIQIGSTVTVGSGGAATIDFSSIPSTYTDLLLVISARTNQATGGAWGDLAVKPNNSTASLTARYLYGTGSGAASATGTTIDVHGTTDSATASTFGNVSVYIPNYAGSTNKSISIDDVTENNATSALAFLNAGLWSNTAAINQLTVYSPAAYTIKQYSTATLYGIKNS